MKKIILLIAIAIVTTSCSSDSGDDTTTNLYPLKVGNTWIYDATQYNEAGSSNTFSYTFKILGDVTRNNFTFSKLSQLTSSDNLAFNLRNSDANTVQGFTSSNDGESNILTMFKKVSVDGEIINQNIDNINDITDTFYGYTTFVNVNGYSCLRNEEIIKQTSTGIILEKTVYYLCPNVGWVKIEVYNKKTTSNELYLEESDVLSSYTLE